MIEFRINLPPPPQKVMIGARVLLGRRLLLGIRYPLHRVAFRVLLVESLHRLTAKVSVCGVKG